MRHLLILALASALLFGCSPDVVPQDTNEGEQGASVKRVGKFVGELDCGWVFYPEEGEYVTGDYQWSTTVEVTADQQIIIDRIALENGSSFDVGEGDEVRELTITEVNRSESYIEGISVNAPASSSGTFRVWLGDDNRVRIYRLSYFGSVAMNNNGEGDRVDACQGTLRHEDAPPDDDGLLDAVWIGNYEGSMDCYNTFIGDDGNELALETETTFLDLDVASDGKFSFNGISIEKDGRLTFLVQDGTFMSFALSYATRTPNEILWTTNDPDFRFSIEFDEFFTYQLQTHIAYQVPYSLDEETSGTKIVRCEGSAIR